LLALGIISFLQPYFSSEAIFPSINYISPYIARIYTVISRSGEEEK